MASCAKRVILLSSGGEKKFKDGKGQQLCQSAAAAVRGVNQGLCLPPVSSAHSLTRTHTHLINKRTVHHHVPQLICGNVLTSTMESTSSLPYQSGSYMSARHDCTFLDDSCMADDTHRHIICVSYGWSTSLTARFPIPVHLRRLFSREAPFTASRYALRSLCSLLPSAYTGERQKVENASVDEMEATC